MIRIGKKLVEYTVLAGVVTFLGLVFLFEILDLFVIEESIVCPPDTNNDINGGFSFFSEIMGEKICASKWFIPKIGIFKPAASPFEKEVPVINAPDKPGPCVTAIPSKSSRERFDSSKAL